MRNLRYHEKKLLRKHNFYRWKREERSKEELVLSKYQIEDREEYKQYNILVGKITQIVRELRELDPEDPFRIQSTTILLDKLYEMGVIDTRISLDICDRISVSKFAKRRFATILKKMGFVQTIPEAVQFIEQGHFMIGTEIVTNPGVLITRTMEDFIKWTKTSAIRRKVMEYNDELDDYDLM